MKIKTIALFLLIVVAAASYTFAESKNIPKGKNNKKIKVKIRQIGNEIQQINNAIVEIRNEKLSRIKEAQKLKGKLSLPQIKIYKKLKPRVYRVYKRSAPTPKPVQKAKAAPVEEEFAPIAVEEAPPVAVDEASVIQKQIKKLTSSLRSLGSKLKRTKGASARKSIMRQMNSVNSKIKALKKKLKNLQGVPEEEVSLPQPERIETPPPPPPVFKEPVQPPPVSKPIVVEKPVEAPSPEVTGPSPFQIKGGLIAGALAADVDYIMSLDKGSDIIVGAGYGAGQDYNVMMAELGMMFKFETNYFGPTINYDNYSNPVMNLIGMPTLINDGGRIGLGLKLGRRFNRLFAEAGYNTSSGIFGVLGYRF